jgi:hypothetical protein
VGYNEIVATACVPRTGTWKKPFQALTFPPSWTRPLLALQRFGRTDPAACRSVPTWRLSQLMRALFPQVISTGRDITDADARPWLYLPSDAAGIPAHLMTAAVLAWIHTINPKPGSEGLRGDLADRIRATPLAWEPTTVDLLRRDLTPGGTAQPPPATYHLLPDTVAADILQLAPASIGSEQIRFRRATAPNGAELISWPPLQAIDDGATGYFSLCLSITVQTVAFSGQLRVHLHTGTRRWATRPRGVPWGRWATVYLLTDTPWIEDVPLTPGFSSSSLGWDAAAGGYGWHIGGAEGMLQRLTLSRDFPKPDELLDDPLPWLLGGDRGVTAAITHHTAMGGHPAGPGLMPADRAPLTEWALAAMSEHLQRIPMLTKSDLSGATSGRPHPPAGSTDSQKTAWKQTRAAEVGHEHQKRLADHLSADRADTAPRERLDVDLMVSSDAIRAGIRAAIMTDLALDEPATDDDGTWHWALETFDLWIHHIHLGPLGDQLTITGKGRRTQFHQQVAERRAAIRSHLMRATTPSTCAVVELSDAFSDTHTDPKFAIRLGCAAAGRVTQFVTPPKKGERPTAFDERMLAVWRDTVRQLGVRAIPQHNLDGIDAGLCYVGVWMTKRRADGATFRAQHLPIAVLLDPTKSTIYGTAPGLPSWVPYRELLLHLADEGSEPVPERTLDRNKEFAGFIKRLTQQLRGTETLLLVHAQNSRSAWPWLQNAVAEPDSVGLGNNPPVALRILAGTGLRIVRVRDSSGRETPQWYSPGRGAPGLAAGLWLDSTLGGRDARTFFSTTPKPSTMQSVAVSASKVVPRTTKTGAEKVDANVQAYNPQLLELTVLAIQEGDNAETLAALAHQQRQTPDYRDALANPLCLHLAKLAGEYLLPHDADDQTEAAEAADVDPMEHDADTSDPTFD